MQFNVPLLSCYLLMSSLLACVTGGCASIDSRKPRSLPARVFCVVDHAGALTCPPAPNTAAQKAAVAAAVAAAMAESHPAPDQSGLTAKYYKPTPSENSMFVEALDKFKKYDIPEGLIGGGSYWLDNDRLVFSSRRYPGWKAGADEPSRINSYNVITGEIADSGYRGRVFCLNHLGDVLIAQSDRGNGDTVKLEDYQWLAGKWGTPLKRIDYLENSTFAPYHCGFIPYGDPIYRDPPEKLKPDAAKVTPLMPQHGVIKETVVNVNGQLQDRVLLIKPNGESIQIANRRPNHFHFTYQPWDDTYFEVNTAQVGPRTFFPSGEVVSHPMPELFLEWKKTLYASVAPFPSRAGIVWGIQQGRRSWRKQGIYLQSKNTLLRIEDGYSSSFLKSSPNGCRIHAAGVRGDPYSDHAKPFDIVIDLCTENLK